MSALTALSSALVAGGLLWSTPVTASEASLSSPLGSAIVAVPNASLEVTGCQKVPVSISVTTLDPSTTWTTTVEVRLSGTAPTHSEFLYGDGTESDDGEFEICDLHGAGRWIASGIVTLRNYGLKQEYELPFEFFFTVDKASTTTEITSVKRGRSSITVTGKSTSPSARYGTVGAPGTVVVEAQTPKSTKWVPVGSAYASSTGTFTMNIVRKIPANSRFRAIHQGSDGIQGSVSPVVRG